MGEFTEGELVEHVNMPAWGPGKVLLSIDSETIVYFRDDPKCRAFRPGLGLLILRDDQSDPQLDNLPPWKDGKFLVSGQDYRVGIGDGIRHFRESFPQGFRDLKYLEGETNERGYKWQAHELYVAKLGNGQGKQLLERGEVEEARDRLLEVEGKVNLLSTFERMALRDGLKNLDGARAFLSAIFDIDEARPPDKEKFTQLLSATDKLPAAKSRVLTWPIVTLFPYLAQPAYQMFLKPEVTQKCAARLNWELQYATEPNWHTYRQLMAMCNVLKERLSELEPRDMIDIQSFIWVIGSPD